ncbi:diguanylate cyclase (GGDEF)-like protein [Hypnocyclicus thermotrophus]|uniref:Diguanylate cyclase (GGDEF)-like protein n=1 Tax=Hypnocyclicus thermotrophus TaxID=1627895 RepID=A0AA46DYX5_9FUSO|nr:GGDEF domain-containing protein [Hypnocyclicus thermotrophus]TDT70470.1 diguanylate cyclase (GGDEF)-like protein [Hypnocyclicus thermotrophus]
MKKIFFIFLLIYNIIFSYGNIQDFEKLNFKSGLISNNVNSITSDSNSIIWFATDNGLSSYDGYNFKNFQVNIFEKNSIPINDITSIVNYNEFMIMLHKKTLVFYNIVKNIFFSIPLSPKQREEFNSKKILIKNNNIYVATNKGLKILLDFTKNNFVFSKFNDLSINDFIFYNDETLLLATNKGLYNFNTSNYSLKKIKNFSNIENIYSIKNNIVFYTNNKLYYTDINGNIKNKIYLEDTFNKIYIDSNNVTWLAGNKKLYYVKNNHLYFFSNKIIKDIYETQNNILWFSVKNEGIYYKNISNDNFDINQNYQNVNKVYLKQNNLFIATNNGLFINDEEIIFDKIIDFKVTHNKIIAYNKNKIYFIDPNTFLVTQTEILNEEIFSLEIYKNTLFLSTENNLYQINLITNEFKPLDKYFPIDSIFTGKRVYLNLNISNHSLFMIVKNVGFVEYDILKNKFKIHNKLKVGNKTYFIKDITSYNIKNNCIYFTSLSAGLLKLNLSDDKLFLISKKIIGEKINDILFLNNNIWLINNTNLLKYSLFNDELFTFTSEDGLLNTRYNHLFYYKNTLFLSGENGYIKFNPINIIIKNNKSKIIFRELNLLNSNQTIDITYTKDITITKANNNFEICFALLEYKQNKNYNYMIKLEGYDKSWKSLGNYNKVKYTNLPAGKYKLNITYIDNNGILSKNSSFINLTIKYPFYYNKYFILFIILLTIFIIIYFINYFIKIRELKIENKLSNLSLLLSTSLDLDTVIHDFLKKLCETFKMNESTLMLNLDDKCTKFVYKYSIDKLYNTLSDEKVILDIFDKNLSLEKLTNGDKIFYKSYIEYKGLHIDFFIPDKFRGALIVPYKNKNGQKILKKLEKILKQAIISINNATLYRNISKFANYDTLTNIYNRRYFIDILSHILEQTKRYSHKLAIVLIDIDYFKKINDTYGHDIGDKVLVEFSKEIQNNIRKSDIFARYGGEEFILALPETNFKEAFNLAERLKNKIEQLKIEVNSTTKISFTASFGLAMYVNEEKLDDIIKKADVALYKAKNSGRNNVKSYNEICNLF